MEEILLLSGMIVLNRIYLEDNGSLSTVVPLICNINQI